MTARADGGPAFPNPHVPAVVDRFGVVEQEGWRGAPGMTLRDWFAGMAMQGICANPSTPDMTNAAAAAAAYVAADAMLAERAK